MRNPFAYLLNLLRASSATTWTVVGIALALTVFTCLPTAEAIFSPLDRIFRQFVATQASYGAQDHVSVILIDKKTVRELGVDECFAHSSHAGVLDRLHEAAGVVINMTMWCAEWDDHALAAAIERQGRVVLPAHISPEAAETNIVLFPTPALMSAAKAVGQRTVVVGDDHLIQGLLPDVNVQETGRTLRHVALEVIRVAGMAPAYRNIEDYIHERVSRLGNVQRGVLSVFLPPRFNLKHYSYVDVLRGAVPDSEWRGKIVYIGDGVSDRAGMYPLSSAASDGTRVSRTAAIAMMTEALLDGHILGKPPTMVKVAINALAVGGTLLVCLFFTGWRMYVMMLGWLILYVAGTVTLLLGARYWLPPGAVVVASCGVFALCGWGRVGRFKSALMQEYRQLRQQAGPGMPGGVGSFAGDSTNGDSTPAVNPAGDEVAEVMKRIRGWQSGYIEMMETLPYAVFVEEHDKLVMCNERGRVLLATLAAPEMGEALSLANHPILVQVREAIAEAKASGHMRSFELNLDGRTHSIIVTPFSDGERYDSTASMTCVVDIHDVRSAVESDRATLRHMAHDLRSPLATVLSLLEERLQANVKADSDFFADIHKLVDYSLRVAQDFTQLSRAGHLDSTEFVPVDVNDVLVDAVDRIWHAANAKEIVIEPPAVETPAYTRGNRDMLLRAMVNLLDNAIKYSHSGTRVRLGLKVADPWLEVSFEDQGVGISEEAQRRLFEPFFQVSEAPYGADRGVGLGLPFVMEVVKQHMGTISVRSSLGEGSSFTLRLPICSVGYETETLET